MNFLYNLSLRTKLLIIVLPLLVGLLLFAFLQVKSSLDQSSSLNKLTSSIDASIRISYLVHEIQKERGNSSGFLSNNGEKFGPQLNAQRELTNERLAELENSLKSEDLKWLVDENKDFFDRLVEYTNEIPSIREYVDELAFTPNEAIDTYTIINTYSLDLLGIIIPETDQSELYGEVQAYINFLKSKERAGIERAIGTQAFSLKTLNPVLMKRFTTLVAEQEAFINSFTTTASNEGVSYLEETLIGNGVDEVDRMRVILFSNEGLSDDPAYWFDMITEKIELLKNVEDYLASGIQSQSGKLADSAKQSLIIVVASIGLLTIVVIALLILILGGILKNIKLLSAFSRTLAKGHFKFKVNIKSNDEIGKFGDTMNRMAFSIRKASIALRKEKEKAEYLYQNTYKTSEVIFENVDQGVFLINSDLEISKLYSKALEKIFNKKEISGKNFTEFINPRLVPRDREALQVFTRHLFNVKVKDKVLNKLNPIETVQIFGETNDSGEVTDSKYIRIVFTRIWEENVIKDVMVTVLDETKEIMLKKEIESNKEKSQQETDQLLNIMKVDPVALREYLDRATEIIDDINDRYEHFKGSDYEDLAKYTFNEVHNLKGNATLIELDLLEEKFHQVEEALVKLRGNRIDGRDFIKVLYELKDIQVTIVDLGRMLRKIADIYYKSNNAEDIYSNEKLFGSFKKVVRRLSDSMDKKADLKIQNDKDIIVPERLKMPINDIIVQLIRNSMVHGIENQHARLSNGKSDNGTIKIALNQAGDKKLEVYYADDGAGIDHDEIIRKAQEIGIYDESDKSSQNGTYAFNLLFADGFSTKGTTDNYGGRGQGMSLVKSILEKNNAQFAISSDLGKNFEIKMTFPLEQELYLNET